MISPREFLEELFHSAVSATLPENCLPTWLPTKPKGRVIIIGAGKAAANMAMIIEKKWGGPLEGIVIVPYGYSESCKWVKVIEASHPMPDVAAVEATTKLINAISFLKKSDTVICLISGGGSSLMCHPVDGVSLAEKQKITSSLLKSGAAIHEINCVRKKLSAIKGGKLANICKPASIITLIISDIPGNDISMVASGPTVTDASTGNEALEILDRYKIKISEEIRAIIKSSKPINVDKSDVRVLATSDDALIAASNFAIRHNIVPYSLGDLSGDARNLGIEHADLATQIKLGNGPVLPPCVIISGGETTVKVRGNGCGGRNGEYALSLALKLNGQTNIRALACDTDGIDGNGNNAGCFISPSTLLRAESLGINAEDLLDQNDSFNFFNTIDDLIITGPTKTNVNDFRAILIGNYDD